MGMTTKEKAKDRSLFKNYGITLEEWKQKFEEQGGVCWICKKMPKSGVLCMDHRHEKNYKKMSPEEKKSNTRGLLCFMCNTSLKSLERTSDGNRNRALLEGIVDYFIEFRLKGEKLS